ncbi:hypothetical protein M405DRAFT_847591 [Rhizopogon salebrosus TDB-379]|nr:hypothetical protein M405DRAFT_847591 [Rhizopogon salebrosus TDB-379]
MSLCQRILVLCVGSSVHFLSLLRKNGGPGEYLVDGWRQVLGLSYQAFGEMLGLARCDQYGNGNGCHPLPHYVFKFWRMVSDQASKVLEQAIGPGIHFGILMLKAYHSQVIADSGLQMCSIITGFHEGNHVVYMIENEKCALDKHVADRLTAVLTASMTMNSGLTIALSVAGSLKEHNDEDMRDEDSDNDEINKEVEPPNDAVDIFVDIEGIIQDLEAKDMGVETVVQGMEGLTIDNGSGAAEEDFTEELKNVSGSKDSDGNPLQAGSSMVPNLLKAPKLHQHSRFSLPQYL